MRYFAASVFIAAAAAVYGLFSHGVYSYWMTYAFMIPLLAGSLPHLIAALKKAERNEKDAMYEAYGNAETGRMPARKKIISISDAQLAFVATLTAGSLLKGALDIYGTTNRLLIVYPVIALLIPLVLLAQGSERKSRHNADQYAGSDAAEQQDREIEEYAEVLDEGRGHQELSQIVQDSCGHADTGH